MTDKRSQLAMLASSNSMNLDFPYQGENHGRIWAIQRPNGSVDAYVQIDKGQLICNPFETCSVTARFDTGQAKRLYGSASSDHDPRILFFQDARGFLKAASTAKRILIEVTLFHSGVQTLEFNTGAPLRLTPPPKK